MAKSNEVSKNGLKFKKNKTTKKKMRKSQKEKPSRNPKIKAGQIKGKGLNFLENF